MPAGLPPFQAAVSSYSSDSSTIRGLAPDGSSNDFVGFPIPFLPGNSIRSNRALHPADGNSTRCNATARGCAFCDDAFSAAFVSTVALDVNASWQSARERTRRLPLERAVALERNKLASTPRQGRAPSDWGWAARGMKRAHRDHAASDGSSEAGCLAFGPAAPLC
jgi:hypothetical protein